MQRGRTDVYRVPVRWADPRAISLSRFLGWLHGKAIRGDNGAIRYGAAGSIQAQRTHYTGYVFPPQIFTRYSAARVAGGRARVAPPAYPGAGGPAPSSLMASPLTRAMETVSAAQRLNVPIRWNAPDGPS